ncbi:diphthine--ammonia ligase [Allobacillus sp. GCM10007491]|uniref:Diphthine--ammonia ligase n=1 Tax=Allobacillus saliphilus TaxID=2912308 RepID=A0A941CVM8_9BACI|nr:diphthine--ammonia ligase [Allobacillus saliphilus]MBR7554039.1 diphthine--ammonia ligase [Allobacillus saliphilus]
MVRKVWVSHSGGKDSMLALHRMMNQSDIEVVGLLTTITEGFERSTTHGIREELIDLQAELLGLPIHKVFLPKDPSNENYNLRIFDAYQKARDEGVSHIVFGDILLKDVRDYREQQVQESGLEAIFPLWGESTDDLIHEFTGLGYETIITTIDPKTVPITFLGEKITTDLLEALPENVDVCGENGEFHTFVVGGPLFERPLPYEVSEQTHEGPYYTYIDLVRSETT